MSTYRFKTNLKCGGCVQSVRPYLDGIKEIREWSVDLNDPDRLLSVDSDSVDPGKIILAFAAAGYTAEAIIMDS